MRLSLLHSQVLRDLSEWTEPAAGVVKFPTQILQLGDSLSMLDTVTGFMLIHRKGMRVTQMLKGIETSYRPKCLPSSSGFVFSVPNVLILI